MRLLLITQDEPFFLADALDYLLSRLPPVHRFVGAVVLSPSPFGKKENALQKVKRTYSVFGAHFLFHYIKKYALVKLLRKPRLGDVLTRHGVPILYLDESINAPSSLAKIAALQPDLLVSIAGNEIFKRPLLDLAPEGVINLHSALLPKYRGLMPSFWVLRHREKFTGVSVFLVDEGIDSGPILVQTPIEIADMTQDQLIRHSKKVGMDAVLEAIGMVASKDPRRLPNDAALATYFRFPTAADVAAFRAVGARFF